MISMNSVWDDAVAFIRREAILLVPLVLATVLVGTTVATLVRALVPPTGLASSLIQLVAATWSLIGQLAITALVMRPGSTVGEALGLALKRLGSVILVGLIFALCLAVMLVPLILGLGKSGIDLAQPGTVPVLPGWASVYVLMIAIAVGWLGIRLCILSALIVDRSLPVIAAIREAFQMTKGLALRLALPLVLFVVVNLILTLAVGYVFGSLSIVVGSALGSPFSGIAIAALANGAVAAAMQLVLSVFLAFVYKRLSTGT